MLKQPARQRSLPFQSKEEAFADMYERLVRIESKLSKVCLALGLDENGRPVKPKPARVPGPRVVVSND